MARIAGVELPDEKRIDIGLAAIFGVGRKLSGQILSQAEVNPGKRVKELSLEELTRLQKAVEKHPVEGTLRQKVSTDIKRLQTTGAYRGVRHSQSLPARGQRTRSNARTRRGKRKTVGAMRKKEMTKLAATKAKKEDGSS